MRKFREKPGVAALISLLIAAAWGVKFILRLVNQVHWDTAEWIVNSVIAALWVIIAVEWIVKWAMSKKNKHKVR